jgi:hypothetical protein
VLALYPKKKAKSLQGRRNVMANEMPNPQDYQNLSRKVLQYCAAFNALVPKLKQSNFSEADWAPLEALVDTKNWVRLGTFAGEKSEVMDWPTYKKLVAQYAGHTTWEGTLRRITETPGLVHLELEERNARNGVIDVSNTVTIYKFNPDGKLINLDVYVSHVDKRAN